MEQYTEMHDIIDETIDSIRNKMKVIANEEYVINNYIPEKKMAKQLKTKSFEREATMEAYRVKSKMYELKKQSDRRKGNVSDDKNNNDVGIMDITSDKFNVVNDDILYLEWRKIDIDEQLLILEKYFENDIEKSKYDIPFSDSIKNELRQLIQDHKLLLKKDIMYDKINKKILDIPLIKFNMGEFELKGDIKKVNIRKQNINNINKILKK